MIKEAEDGFMILSIEKTFFFFMQKTRKKFYLYIKKSNGVKCAG